MLLERPAWGRCRKGKQRNVRFYPTAAARREGFRACKRCRPDMVPGSPEWDERADVVGCAMRLIADGVVDREGVAGLARRLCHTERNLHRLLATGVGAGPLALARARRALSRLGHAGDPGSVAALANGGGPGAPTPPSIWGPASKARPRPENPIERW